MRRLFAIILIATIASCNNDSENTAASDSTTAASTTNQQQAYTWSKDEEGEFLAGCVGQAKARLGEEKAFVHCNCVLSELKKNFPNIDSAAPVLMDVQRAAEFAAPCK
jgi:hypothetical protein